MDFGGVDNGAYALKNVRSQMYVTIENRLDYDKQYLIQYPIGAGAIGHSLWHLRKSDVPQPNIFYFFSVYSGKAITTYNNEATPGEHVVQQTIDGTAAIPDMRMRWELIPVSRTDESAAEFNDVENVNNQREIVVETDAISSDILVTQSLNVFHINSQLNKLQNISVMTVSGMKEKEISVSCYDYILNLSQLQSGIHIMRIMLDNGYGETRKIIIR